ncbi:hypothetical protein BC835DRAFT_1419116 [Cytidiella melzeri]|nr:hypothetical protein BC835DRAFT_1419116 [Cytidiella melzeri]
MSFLDTFRESLTVQPPATPSEIPRTPSRSQPGADTLDSSPPVAVSSVTRRRRRDSTLNVGEFSLDSESERKHLKSHTRDICLNLTSTHYIYKQLSLHELILDMKGHLLFIQMQLDASVVEHLRSSDFQNKLQEMCCICIMSPNLPACISRFQIARSRAKRERRDIFQLTRSLAPPIMDIDARHHGRVAFLRHCAVSFNALQTKAKTAAAPAIDREATMSSVGQGDSDPNAATAGPDTEEATDMGLDPSLELTEEIDEESDDHSTFLETNFWNFVDGELEKTREVINKAAANDQDAQKLWSKFFTECLLADLKTYPVTSKRMFKKTTVSQPSELQKSAERLLVSW